MARRRYLPNAPITEAVIDLRVSSATEVNHETLLSIIEPLRQRFPKVGTLGEMEAVFAIKEGAPVEPQTKALPPRGYVLHSPDGLFVVQFRTNGFTFSRLKPYTHWEEVLPQALELWRLYASVAQLTVTRVATRFINHIRLPGMEFDFDDYLTAGPEVPPELPQRVANFLIRVVVADPGARIAANVTQAFERGADPRFTTVILDIDAYKVQEFKPEDPALVEAFETLREFKNRIFFSHITEKTASMYE